MAFDNIIGLDSVKKILLRCLEKKRIPHALLFHGPEGIGKEALAIEFAKALICQKDEVVYCNTCPDCKRIESLNHPDFIFYYPANAKTTEKEHAEIKKSIITNPYLRLKPFASPGISIDKIRELKRICNLTSLENKGRVVIIADAHCMTIEAANSLLKILEEPPEHMHIILTTSRMNLLLPTIISRCQLVRFSPIPWQQIVSALNKYEQVEAVRAELISKMSFGSYQRALELLEQEFEQKREKAIDILRTLIKGTIHRLELVDELTRTEHKNNLKVYIELILLWFRDALVYSEDPKSKLIINADQLDVLERFCASFDSNAFESIVMEIEKSIDLFNRNVYVNLILIHLFNFLKRNLRRKV